MSKDQRAPGELENVRAFVNTIDIEEGTEQLSSPVALADWLREHGLAPAGRLRATEIDLDTALALREALRAILRSHVEGEPVATDAAMALDDIACRSRLRVRFDKQGGAGLEPEAQGVDGALGRLVAIVHGAIAEGTWERLKACREHACAWAFYDHAKNRSGAWCSMEECGNRAKARAYRERRAASTA
jgi:predicted RNA-binding Zn ribbon-like protein